MAGPRITADMEKAVHRQWRKLPWRYRWLGLVPGERKRIEEMAVRGFQRTDREA